MYMQPIQTHSDSIIRLANLLILNEWALAAIFTTSLTPSPISSNKWWAWSLITVIHGISCIDCINLIQRTVAIERLIRIYCTITYSYLVRTFDLCFLQSLFDSHFLKPAILIWFALFQTSNPYLVRTFLKPAILIWFALSEPPTAICLTWSQ